VKVSFVGPMPELFTLCKEESSTTERGLGDNGFSSFTLVSTLSRYFSILAWMVGLERPRSLAVMLLLPPVISSAAPITVLEKRSFK
jgi:hypothetical protein